MVVAFTPIDLRKPFDLNSYHNGTSSLSIVYNKDLNDKDLSVRTSSIRNVLNTQAKLENLYIGVKENVELIKYMSIKEQSIEEIAPMFSLIAANNQRASYTYSLTYPGKFNLIEKAEEYIDNININVTSYALPITITASEYKGIIHLIFRQSFDSDRLAKAIFKEIKQLIPQSEYYDKGYYYYDEVNLNRFEHLYQEDENEKNN